MSNETISLLPSESVLRTHGPHQYILALAFAMPTIRHKMEMWSPPRFDVDVFMDMAGKWSTGEYLTARFIASVWNPASAKKRKWLLDVTNLATLDRSTRELIIQWVNSPVWP